MKPLTAALMTLALLGLTTRAVAEDPAMTMFGINHNTGALVRYDMAEGELNTVGSVRLSLNGAPLTGIEASAYLPGFQQIHAFWLDPYDGQSKMILVDTENALATVDVVNLGTGKVDGAVGVVTEVPNPLANDALNPTVQKFRIYLVQQDEGSGDGVSGGLNINPNNNDDSEFTCVTATGVITRDDLHMRSTTDSEGVFYEGLATSVRVKPKGNGNQNSLVVNGEVFAVANSTTYTIQSEDMTVRIQNDKVKNGKAMGHWWVAITAGHATITPEGGTAIEATPQLTSKLMSVDTQTRDVTDLFHLSRVYDSLATLDGVTFYATSNDRLYTINGETGAESLISSFSSDDMLGLEFSNTTLKAFDADSDRLLTLNGGGNVTAMPNTAAGSDFGTITFMPTELVPEILAKLYD
ncbi:hypothetical protein HED60_10250 [Planctomycetales bacterium ZRK34]|nr:hypothetical protein HED60_10250 [Planctomycetales bacterium ZRK34]